MSLTNEQAAAILWPIYERFDDAVQNMRLDEIISYYDEDSVLIAIGSSCAYGKNQIREKYVEFGALLGKAVPTYSNKRIEGVGDTLILRAHSDLVTENGGKKFSGDFEQIWRKKGDAYVIIHDHYTFAPAA